ncbi:MAG: PqqD family protein [Deltaproteobacteria bacterium]|nr:PqqD family protein [Deltaproteobacteria bacterium]
MDHKLEARTLIRRDQDILATEMDGEYLILSIEQGSYIALRDVSARIWELLESPRPVTFVFETLLGEYAVDRKTCEAEVSAFLRQMAENGLISFENPA